MTRTGPSPFFFASLALAAILLLPGPAAAQDDPGGTWRPPDLIDAVASFGAVAHDGALYVYGGHVGRTHAHSLENVSPAFRRLVLEPGRKWEELARGPLLQGAALVSDGAAIYRVGGMTASNATTAEPEVLHSSRSAARYSVAADRWEPLPDLPAGRSSHDAVVAGGVLYVVGGWELRGPDEDAVWADTVLALDHVLRRRRAGLRTSEGKYGNGPRRARPWGRRRHHPTGPLRPFLPRVARHASAVRRQRHDRHQSGVAGLAHRGRHLEQPDEPAGGLRHRERSTRGRDRDGLVVRSEHPAKRSRVQPPNYAAEPRSDQRLGSFFWVQSMVRDDGCRTLLFDLDMAVQKLSRDAPDHPTGVQLTGIYHNLLRRWAEV